MLRRLLIMLGILLANGFVSDLAIGKTAAKPSKGKSRDLSKEEDKRYWANLNPGTEVPRGMPDHQWRVTGKINGQVIYPKEVPVYAFDDDIGGRGTVVGMEQVGKPLKVERVRMYRERHYYGVAYQEKTRAGQVINKWRWYDGLSIERAD